MINLNKKVAVVGGGLAGSEASLQLAKHKIHTTLFEMRPKLKTPVHKSSNLAELVCSNSLKSEKSTSAAGMLKRELEVLGSYLLKIAKETRVEAGGALAVDRDLFSKKVTQTINKNEYITVERNEIIDFHNLKSYDAIILATGPMTSEKLSKFLSKVLGCNFFHFFDAAAPIVSSDSLDFDKLFSQNRYENEIDNIGDYLNAPFNKTEYETFINELVNAKRVVLKEFETKDLFSACLPIEEIAKKGTDAPRFGPLKPVGIVDPKTNLRPWAVVQLRSENRDKTAYNLVGFQTNLTFSEQKRIFRMIPGLENAEFGRYGVMHKNIFIDAPSLLDANLCCSKLTNYMRLPVYVAGQLSGTEGYVEAIRSGLHAAISAIAQMNNTKVPYLPNETVFGSLIEYATSKETVNYQPMHVNFGIIKPLDVIIKNKQIRYEEYRKRAENSMNSYCNQLNNLGLL